MKRPTSCSCITLLCLLVLLITPKESSSRPEGGRLSVSPITHLASSVAASAAHGSVAAVRSLERDKQEYVVIVTFKPSKTAPLLQEPQTREKPTETRFGLKLSNAATQATASARWTQLGDSSVCVMTGFAADVQHLTGVTLKQVETRQCIYSHAMSVDRIVRALASTVQRAARFQESRPYGVQALVVGLDTQGKIQLYTLDPLGGWQHYGGGATAIGRGAQDVRAQLYKELMNATTTEDEKDASEALRIAITSLVGESINENDETDYSDKMEALLVSKSESGSCCVSRIDDSEVDACLKRILEKK